MTLRVVIADDQEMIRTGLRMILESDPDIEVVAEAADGREAVALAPPAAAGRVPVRHPHAGAGWDREPLTEREEEVLVAVAQGRTNAEIAAELHISLSPAKTHLASLMRKLDARNRVEIAMWAHETGRLRR
jgi:DNA-binding NarL/FixJ family response regulator